MDTIATRRSVRKYNDTPVARELIDEIIQAAILAPSAKNRQPWKYIVYQGQAKDELLDEMERGLLRERDGAPSDKLLPESAQGLPDAFWTLKVMRQAPVLIIIENTNGSSPYEDIDTTRRISEICDTLSIGASIENMLLRATQLELGTLWIANTCFAYNELATHIGIQGQLVGAVSLGYADENPKARPRKALEDVVEYRE